MTAGQPRLRKTLTANDVGHTGSHQAGIHVPKLLVEYFPLLDASQLNPDTWLEIASRESTHHWRFIYYNNAVVGQGTRDEYRLTHVTGFLREATARPGDVLELTRIGARSYAGQVMSGEDESGVLTLSIEGPWRVVRIGHR